MDRPTTTLCPVCGDEFQQSRRAHGGGRRAIYCSPNCRSQDWARGNAGKRKAQILKYEQRPENKEAKRRRTRKATLARYSWTEDDLRGQLARQRGRCRGCLSELSVETARIDHDHETGRVRGLLCDRCNWALGHARDSAAILRRLTAHLDVALEQQLVYVGGALKNPRVPEVGNLLRSQGYDAMDEWFTPGEAADENWQKYEKLRGRDYVDALRGRAATNIFLFDSSYLSLSDALVMVMPVGKSGMLELGYAAGLGLPTVMFTDGVELERFEVMPAVISAVAHTEEELVAILKELLP